jgi:hypothetical protein
VRRILPHTTAGRAASLPSFCITNKMAALSRLSP